MTILEAAVGEDEIQWSFNCELLPKNLVSDGRIFELIWTPVLSADQGLIQDVLLVIKDVTELRTIVIENERSQRENEIILQIIKTRSKDFQTFVANSHLCLEMVHKVFFRKDSLSRTEDINEIWRRLHTLKGVSRGLGFRDISAKIHDAESCLREVEGQTAYQAASLERFKAIVLSLEADLLEYKRIDHDVLKRDLNHGFDVSSADMAPQVAQIEAALELPVIRKDDLISHLHELKSLYQDSLEKVAHSQMQNLQKIAEGSGKPLPSLMIKGSRHFFDDPIKDVMDFVLMHLFRNSLDHGIEEPAERLRKGKAMEGTITLTLQNHGQRVQIIYKDDGRGLDLEKVRKKALEMALIRPDAQLSALDIANLVWLPGFSTAERVTEISGRGVGMDAVRSGLETIGGRISIVLEEPEFHFVIELPKNAPRALPPVSRAG
jgi:chemotaxis protein histidine kinase CheA